jgi:hypothetical protein
MKPEGTRWLIEPEILEVAPTLALRTFNGNRAGGTFVEVGMGMVERKFGRARHAWVFDRGIVSEENLAAVQRRGLGFECHARTILLNRMCKNARIGLRSLNGNGRLHGFPSMLSLLTLSLSPRFRSLVWHADARGNGHPTAPGPPARIS